METVNKTSKTVLLIMFKDFSTTHTITSLAKQLKLSRVGMWKVLKKLEVERYIDLKSVGSGKTSTSLVKINWENPLLEKTISLYLTEEAVKQRRWQVNFAELERTIDFVVLYGSILHSQQEANDIDVLTVNKKSNFINIQKIIDKVQKTQTKKIHAISFTETEFKLELKKSNQAFIEALKKGIVLFGQDSFVRFIKGMIHD